MRLKIKHGAVSKVLATETSADICTIRELKQLVAHTFEITEDELALSLNKIDELSGEESVLASHGIVSGDLLHIINPPPRDDQQGSSVHRTSSRPQPLASYSSSDSRLGQSSSTQGQSSIATRSESNMSVAQEHVAEAVEMKYDPEVNRYLNEPLVVRESTGEQVPAMLSQLYRSAACQSKREALWLCLHTLMLESGFTLPKEEDSMVMPHNYKKSGFFSFNYELIVTSDITSQCSLIAVHVGSCLIIHGLSKDASGYKTDQLQLKTDNFIRELSEDTPAVYRSLDRLSKIFKDTICLPLINHLTTAAGFEPGQGLLSLPAEVKIRLLSFLNARSLCRLSQTCQDLHSFSKDKTIWRRLYLNTFGRLENISLSRNWYELYRDRHLHEVKRQEERRRLLSYIDQPPWGPDAGPFSPFFPPFPVPGGVVGGDYDLNPFHGGNFPNPFGRGGGGGGAGGSRDAFHNRRLPHPDIPDPFSLGTSNPLLPNPNNCMGSPFSHQFRGPF